MGPGSGTPPTRREAATVAETAHDERKVEDLSLRIDRLEDWCSELAEELRRVVEVTSSAGTVLATAYRGGPTQDE